MRQSIRDMYNIYRQEMGRDAIAYTTWLENFLTNCRNCKNYIDAERDDAPWDGCRVDNVYFLCGDHCVDFSFTSK